MLPIAGRDNRPNLILEGGEDAMTDRILEWLRLDHDTPELRTERGIAAMLEWVWMTCGVDSIRSSSFATL